MSDVPNQKSLARSKHHHSQTKDKNRWKKKGEHVRKAAADPANQKKKQAEKKPEEEEESDSEEGENEEGVLKKTGRSKYSRRIVQSNEFRFSEELGEYEEETRGVDINKALAEESNLQGISNLIIVESTGDENFRFESEKEWDEAQNFSIEIIGLLISQRLPLLLQLGLSDSEMEKLGLPIPSPPPLPEAVEPLTMFTLFRTEPKETKKTAIRTPAPQLDRTTEADTHFLESISQKATKAEEVVEEPKEEQEGEEDLESWLDTVI